MAFSYGFYNSINNDRRYDAIQMSMIFDGIIRDGVYSTIGKSFIVKATGEENMVIVQPGRAWFNHTWNYNDANLPIKSDQSELLLDRIDALVIDINSNENFRINNIIWVKGTPSSTPVRPTLVNTLDHHQYPLCYIHRKPNVEIIAQGDITNMVGTSECPFVTGILDSVSIDDLLLQWKDQWSQFMINYEKMTAAWTKEQQDDFDQFYNEFKNQMTAFEQASGKEFTDWFNGVRDILDQNTAGQLLNMIEELDKREFNHYYDLVNSSTVIDKSTGNIKTSTADGVSTTRFQKDDSGNKTIITTIEMNSGNFDYVRTTTVVNTSSEKQIDTTYIRRPK